MCIAVTVCVAKASIVPKCNQLRVVLSKESTSDAAISCHEQ